MITVTRAVIRLRVTVRVTICGMTRMMMTTMISLFHLDTHTHSHLLHIGHILGI